MRFHNPYHFAPAEKIEDANKIHFDAPELTHDRYLDKRFCGRVVCRLVAESPIFVGSRRTREADETHPAEVEHYKIGEHPAIPATTLRGMISSLVEAATNSALRVLGDETYSFRRKMGAALSALGMIVEENGDLRLRPLTLPTMTRERSGRGGYEIKLPEKYQQLFQHQGNPNLRAYFADDYDAESRDYHDKFQTYTDANQKFYYLKLNGECNWDHNAQGQRLAEANILKNRAAVIGQQQQDPDNMPLTQEEYDALSCHEKRDYRRGILRIMRIAGRDLPIEFKTDRVTREKKRKGRRLEVFIPYPKGAETWPVFEIQPEAIARFHALADSLLPKEENERQGSNGQTEDLNQLLPYHPVNTPRNKPGKDARRFRLKQGDLVFFLPDAGGTMIEEISLSAIWRDRVENPVTHEAHTARRFFREIDKELLPFSDERTCVTIAESMFGFVNESKRASSDTGGKMRAFAGRVFFSPARLFGVRDEANPAQWLNSSRERSCAAAQLDAKPLKILASPKPPSPAMYFKMKNGTGGYIAKSDLNADEHRPQGRKFYLHRRDGEGDTWTTKAPTEDRRQKVKIAPVKSGAVFFFHVDFENLSGIELGALLYALRPTNEFRHKVGMGKPLGLGTVKIEPVALLGINRRERYTAQGLFAPRYAQRWQTASPNSEVWAAQDQNATLSSLSHDELPAQYARLLATPAATFSPAPGDLHKKFRDAMSSQIRHALELIGDPNKLQAPVHTPTAQGQPANAEQETFTWFVHNDNEERENRQRRTRDKIMPRRQFLKPLSDPANAERIEPLEENMVIESR